MLNLVSYIYIYIKITNVTFKPVHVRVLIRDRLFCYAYSNINIQLNTAVLVPHAQPPNRATQREPDGKDELEPRLADSRWRNMLSSA